MARTGESSPVVDVPGFGRVADAVKRGVLKLTTPLFGTPESPTALGRAMDFVDDAAQVGLMTYGASAARLADPKLMRRALGRNPGMEAHRLRRRTGYSRGLFGMGVETHGDASFKPSALFRQGPVEGRLSDLAYVHRDVSTAYPGMESVRVKVVPDSEWATHVEAAKASVARVSAYTPGASASGFTVHGGDMAGIYVRGWKPGEPMDVWFSRADSTLVHEMQHVAQEADGVRAPYAHLTREDYLRDAREVDARNSAYRRLLTGDERGMMLRGATQDTAPELVNLDDKGGDNYGTFRNFLATDDVPETIFGFPVVQREEDYTESDLKFFKENPKAAGFYDLGDDEGEVGSQEAWGGGLPLMFAMAAGHIGAQNEGRSDVLKGLARFKQLNGNRTLSDATATDATARDLLRRTGWQFGYAPGEIAMEIADPDVNPLLPLRGLFTSDDARKEQQYKAVKSASPGSAAYHRKLALELRQTAAGRHAYDEQHHRYDRLLSAARAMADESQVWVLSDFLDFNHGGGDRLRKMYPGVTGVNVRVERAPAGTKASGYYQKGKGVVLYDTAVVKAAQDPSLLRDLLVHETQHIVQERERWVSGGNVDRASSEAEYRRYFGEIGAYNTQRRIHDKPGLFWDTTGYKPSEGLMPSGLNGKGQ